MNIRRVSWTPYRIPFKNDFRTAHGPIPVREGAILRLETGDGRVGLGDIAPLASFNGETLAASLHFLAKEAPDLVGSGVPALVDAQLDDSLCAVRCALDAAFCDLSAQEHAQSMGDWLSKGSAAQVVAVNATIGATQTEDAVREARKVVALGFRVAKLKVGVLDSDDAEIERISAVYAALGTAHPIDLRLDANGAWTPKQAINIINALQNLERITLVEQPTSAGDLTALTEVQRSVAVDIAADESVSSGVDVNRIVRLQEVRVIVIKPPVIGGLRRSTQLIRLAEEKGLQVIVTSMLESGIGVAGALHLAATLTQPALACGLATTSLLEADLLKTPLEVRDGYMHVPQGSGLGVELDEDQLARYGGETVVVE